MIYNVVKKTFPTGIVQYKFYDNVQKNGFPKAENKSNPSDIKVNKSIESLKSSVKRSKNNIYDLARCVNWDYFITLTLNNIYCDRFDYTSCTSIIKLFTKWCRRYGLIYMLVPEQHKNGAWHFHGLIYSDNKDIYKKMLLDSGHKSNGNTIYNIKTFKYGFTTATVIRDTDRVSSYISKYITKSFNIPKGKKRYWVSQKIDRPIEKAYFVKDNDLEDVISVNADFSKILGNFNSVRFYEIHKTK